MELENSFSKQQRRRFAMKRLHLFVGENPRLPILQPTRGVQAKQVLQELGQCRLRGRLYDAAAGFLDPRPGLTQIRALPPREMLQQFLGGFGK